MKTRTSVLFAVAAAITLTSVALPVARLKRT